MPDAEITNTLRTLLVHAYPSGAKLLVAVSGGPDSLCLLHALAALRDTLPLEVYAAHLDHQLRGMESAADAAFVESSARAWGIPITLAAHDVRAAAHGSNLSATAREVRYRFLAATALAVGADAVLTAHQADDQAETVLLNLLRGAGPDGLAGMPISTPWKDWRRSAWNLPPHGPVLLRPLLHVRRATIDAYCRDHGLVPRSDPTNTQPDYVRSRIRHELLPILETYNPQVVAALTRTAAVCATDAAYIAAQLAALWPDLAHARPGAFDFRGAHWRTLHPALQRAALRFAHAHLAQGSSVGLEQIDHARAVTAGGVGKQAELPGGITLTVGYAGDFTLGAPAALDAPHLPADELWLPEQGSVALGGWQLRIEATWHAADGRWSVCLDREQLDAPLLLRRRRPGDRLRPPGAPGSRRIQDLFVDAHIPRAARAAWPILATPHAPIWLVGVAAEARVLANDHTHRPLFLSVESGGVHAQRS